MLFGMEVGREGEGEGEGEAEGDWKWWEGES